MKAKLTNSASLGKTIARNRKSQLSQYPQPKQFDAGSVKQTQQSKKRKSIGQKSKQSAQKYIASQLSIEDSRVKLQLNRQKCVNLGEDVLATTIDKSFKINKMYKDLHHFLICIDELKWILKEGDRVMQRYMSQIALVSPSSSHAVEIQNMAHEFRSLVIRFSHIEKNRLWADNYLKDNLQSKEQASISVQQSNPQRNHLKAFIQRSLNISTKPKEQQNSMLTSMAETRHFSLPLKENRNSSNLPYFDNIKLIKQQQEHAQQKQNRHYYPLKRQTQSNKEDIQNILKKNIQIQNNLKQMNNNNTQLKRINQSLQSQIQYLQIKLSKYTAVTAKTMQNQSWILERMMGDLNSYDRKQQLLKIKQSLKIWQEMFNSDDDQAKYREIYGNPETFNIEKNKKLQELVAIQYEINALQAKYSSLSNVASTACNQQQNSNQDMYRMLIVQSCAFEQLCNF